MKSIAQTGGIRAAIESFENRKEEGKATGMEFLNCVPKAMYDKIPFIYEMIQEIVFTTDFTDEKRLKEILAEEKSRLQG